MSGLRKLSRKFDSKSHGGIQSGQRILYYHVANAVRNRNVKQKHARSNMSKTALL
jgi:hypothetical protein